MKKIMVVVDAPGPAEFIAPVLPKLSNYDLELITVGESPTKILAKQRPIRLDREGKAAAVYKKFNPDALLVATSSLVLGPYINNKFTKLAHSDGKKIIAFQDYWANHRWPMNLKMMKYWNALLVIDELAKKFVLADGYQGKIIITGSPAFDRFKDVDVLKEKRRLRKKFGIPENAFVILHCGTGTPQSWREDEATFKFLAEVVRQLKKEGGNIIFISRPHPRDEHPERYKKLAPDLKIPEISSIELTEDILPIADLILGMYSTNLIHACYLRIPGISILLPNAGKKRLAKISLSDFPPNKIGATIGIYKESVPELKKELEKIMEISAYRSAIQARQKRFFPMEKSATKKAADAIKQLIS